MIKGKLENGFEFEISDEIFDDFELLELFADVDENPIYIGRLAEKMLGKDQKKALVEHLRRDDGKVHTSDIMAAMAEIEGFIPQAKN